MGKLKGLLAEGGIHLDDIQKFKNNCKMSVMDELENVGGIIVKEIALFKTKNGIRDKEVAFIVDKTEELLRTKPNDLDEESLSYIKN